MLSSGAHAVPSSACLRCQLRSVLQRSRCLQAEHHRLRSVYRAFSAQQHRHDDIGPRQARGRTDYYYRHVSPEGKIKIIGKKGRKQRQVSEPLSIDSLGRKSEVIVLRDFEEKESHKHQRQESRDEAEEQALEQERKHVSAEDIQAAIAQSDIPADEKEVAASINDLRPRDAVLDKAAFSSVMKQLQDGYTAQQLSGYLQALLRQKPNAHKLAPGPIVKGKSVVISQWRPGRTLLQLRPNMAPPAGKKNSVSAKARAADQILRRGWEVTVTSEEQEIGELEIKMLPVHFTLLFETMGRGRPNYEAMIKSPLLLKSSRIQPYAPANIARVTARRQDAEEIARRLEAGVSAFVKTDFHFSSLRPLMEKDLRSLGWRRIFSTSDIEFLSKTTQSLIEVGKGDVISIWSSRASDGATAKRLLISLLFDKLALQTELVNVLPKGREYQEHAKQDPFALLPVYPLDSSLQYRHRGKMLGRISMPQVRQIDSGKVSTTVTSDEEKAIQSPGLERIHERMTTLVQKQSFSHYLDTASIAHVPSATSYWPSPPSTSATSLPGQWQAHLGHLLRDGWQRRLREGELMTSSLSKSDRTGLAVRPATVFSHQVPASEALLSYLRPRNPPSTSLTAHFIPSPFLGPQNEKVALWHRLPRIEVEFARSRGAEGNMELESCAVRAIFQRRLVDVPMPNKSVDLRFARDVCLDAKLPDVFQDKDVKSFIDHVTTTAAERGPAALSGLVPPELTFRLPGWMMSDRPETAEDVRHPFVFDHFENSQTIDFAPNEDLLEAESGHLHPAAVDLLQSNAYVRYRDVDGGVLNGKRTEISLGFDDSESSDVPSKGLLASAMQIADLVTKAAKGEVRVYEPAAERMARAQRAQGDDEGVEM